MIQVRQPLITVAHGYGNLRQHTPLYTALKHAAPEPEYYEH